MKRTQLNTSRLVIGLLVVMTATLLFVVDSESVATAGIVAVLVQSLREGL